MVSLARSSTLALAATLLASAAEIKHNPKDGLIYVRIPPGTYSMGCSSADAQCFTWEPAPHPIRIDAAFWIGQTEVTQAAYLKVTGSNPSLYRGPNLPVDQVSWFDATHYCEAVGMRLPTEAEWEYAARAGSPAPFYAPLDSIAWYDPNSHDQTHPVAAKKPNAFGLYDMLGNLWEWVQDTYSVEPSKRILRGGSFYNPARELRVSNRLWALPDTAHRDMGFRCAAN